MKLSQLLEAENYGSIIKRYAIETLSKVNFPVPVYLFGSTARGTCNEKSDIDLLIEFKSLDCRDINNSCFYRGNIGMTGTLDKIIGDALGNNPITGLPFELQLVGPYELRFFEQAKIDDVMRTKILF